MLNAYSFHNGEPIDGAVLVFAPSFKVAKKLAYPVVRDWSGCEYTEVRGYRIRHDEWLKANAADKLKLAARTPHVIESPPACKGCDLWHDELDSSGHCETCAEEREEEA
ncbi:hypothetical protein [Marinobacter sp.]|uniref:hypothetical protein n=1 Tax=Marinobacter sp. TaxID=50741 RepID=UPI003A946319